MQLCAGGRPLGSGTDPSPPTRARSPADVKGFSRLSTRLTGRPHDGRRADRRAFTLEGATELRLRSPRQARNPCFAGDYRGSRSCATTSWQRTGLAAHPPDARRPSCLVRAATNRDVRAGTTLGLRESITHRYDDLTHALDEQLGLQPTRETRVMYRQLLGQD
jgi:hypothetical protein